MVAMLNPFRIAVFIRSRMWENAVITLFLTLTAFEVFAVTVDSWQPAPAPASSLPTAQLELIFSLASAPFNREDVSRQLEWLEPLARSEKAVWTEVASQMNEAELRQCIEFFTHLEEQCNLDLGSKSPVIPLFKVLKKQVGIDRDLVQWVKSNTQNKYLPFGPLG